MEIDKKNNQLPHILKKCGYILSQYNEERIEILTDYSKSKPVNIITIIGIALSLFSLFYLINGEGAMIVFIIGVVGLICVMYPVVEHYYGNNYKLFMSKSENKIVIQNSFLTKKMDLPFRDLQRIEFKGFSSYIDTELDMDYYTYQIDVVLKNGKRVTLISFIGDDNTKMKSYAVQCSSMFCDFLNIDKVFTGYNVMMSIEQEGRQKKLL